ncbi:MAG: cysteine hydrolase [Luteimonas sp.]|nr:cysteine hydrolase [Luteimonas sp.]
MPKSLPALLIVDMINLFDFEDGRPLAKATLSIAATVRRLRDRFDTQGAPVIYANDNFTHWKGEFRDLVARCAEASSESAAIASTLAPGNDHYHILKPKHSAFLATALPVLLTKLKVRQLVITGITVDSCILATAQDAVSREFELWIPSDAVAAATRSKKQHALAVIGNSLDAVTSPTGKIQGLFPGA